MKQKILIAEDDSNLRQLIIEILLSCEYEVDSANNGLEAKSFLEKKL
ncbi:MAG: hypothetical protein ACLGGX_12445 [Bdellovibrionia bacterium]